MHQALILTYQAGMLHVSQTWLACSLVHQASILTYQAGMLHMSQAWLACSLMRQALILTYQAGMLALSQTWSLCLMVHQASTKTSVLGVPSCLLPLLVTCFLTLVALTRAILQDLQDPGVVCVSLPLQAHL
jgi:hypothetical protein